MQTDSKTETTAAPQNAEEQRFRQQSATSEQTQQEIAALCLNGLITALHELYRASATLRTVAQRNFPKMKMFSAWDQHTKAMIKAEVWIDLKARSVEGTHKP